LPSFQRLDGAAVGDRLACFFPLPFDLGRPDAGSDLALEQDLVQRDEVGEVVREWAVLGPEDRPEGAGCFDQA
jgi:hypothetical protein